MQTIHSELKKGSTYRQFEVLDVRPIDDYSAEGIWLRHKTTGLEVFHMYCADEENLFAFAFKTPPADSTGVAHIMEHSVLCGSRLYPLKDPFIRMANQSIKTFLNAMTFSDKTVYPAASVSRTDYFNLMSVYGDAVFFPKLQELIFAQEGHRLELDDQGRPVIQGVVYNEMKGCYSSFENIAGDWAVRSLLPGTIYDVDSGGDPVEIPRLTYGQFCAFHRTYYAPSNCKVFLYGNIETTAQLDFIQEKFLDAFDPSVTPESAAIPGLSSKQTPGEVRVSGKQTAVPAEPDSMPGAYRMPLLPEAPEPFAQPVVLEKPAPAADSGNRGCTVTMSWLIGDSSDPEQYMEAVLLAEILTGHDGSPLLKALLDCGLGEDVAPNCGVDGEMHWVMLTAGLRGVQRENASRVEKVILSTLERICREGLSPDDITAAVQSVDFSQREIRRVHGPFSLVLMRRCLRGWLYGRTPFHTVSSRSAFDRIKDRIISDSEYVYTIIRRYLLDNNHRSLVTVYPDEQYQLRREAAERELATRLLNETSAEQIRLRQEELRRFQQTEEPEDIVRLLPHLKPADLSVAVDRIETRRCELPGGIPFFYNEEPTNGIVYFDVCIPVDSLAPEDYLLLPLYATVLTNCGFAGTGWAQTASRIALNTGGFGAGLFTSSMMNGNVGQQVPDKDPVAGRDWIFIKMKFLNEQLPGALSLMSDCLLSVDFSDIKRISDLALEYRNDLNSSVVPMGNDYAANRAAFPFSRSKTVDEIWNGLTQLYFVNRLVPADVDRLPEKLRRIHARLLSAGTVIHTTGDAEGVAAVRAAVDGFVSGCGLAAPGARHTADSGILVNLAQTLCGTCEDSGVYSAGTAGSSRNSAGAEFMPEIFCTDTAVGFAATACTASGCNTKEAVYESVLAHRLTNTSLWEQIRTVGGAYGAFAWTDSVEQIFSFATYRDPKPFRSLDVFTGCLKCAADMEPEELERVITGCYSKEIQPRSPSGRGFTGFLRMLYGFTDAMREQRIAWLLGVSVEALKNTAEHMCIRFDSEKRQSVVCGSTMLDNHEKNTGKIMQLPV